MNRTGFILLIAMLTLASPVRAQDTAPLKLVHTITLSGVQEGDFDHFAADAAGHRLFLSAEKNGAVFVFDTDSNSFIHTIRGLKAPHAILYRGDLDKIFIVDGDDSAVKIYDGHSYELAGQVALSIDADSMTYDPATTYMYVVNGGREAHTSYSLISVVDTSNAKKLKDIKVDSNWVEALAIEKAGRRLFSNITSENAVGVLDRTAGVMLAKWPIPPEDKLNVALTFDETNHRLLVVSRNPSKLIVLNSDTGAVITSLPCVDMADDMAYDTNQKRIYVAGNQFVNVFQQQDADHYVLLAKLPGGFRAKTGILVPDLHRYFLAVPRHGNQPAEVRVYEVQP